MHVHVQQLVNINDFINKAILHTEANDTYIPAAARRSERLRERMPSARMTPNGFNGQCQVIQLQQPHYILINDFCVQFREVNPCTISASSEVPNKQWFEEMARMCLFSIEKRAFSI